MKTNQTILETSKPGILVLTLILVSAFVCHAADGTPLWTNLIAGSTDAAQLAVDGSGNVIVAGTTTNSSTGKDYVIVKYSSAGAALWTNIFSGNGSGHDIVASLALDSNGNVFVAGVSSNDSSGNDFATIKYSNIGMPLWTNFFNREGGSDDGPRSLTVDAFGNALVAGYSKNTAGYYDYTTIKYSNSGAALWTNLLNFLGNINLPDFIAVDNEGRIYVTGLTYRTALNSDFATVKYSSTGEVVWTNIFGRIGNRMDYANHLVIDLDGSVVVTGSSSTSASSFDYATIKYAPTGSPLWTNFYNGTANYVDHSRSVTLDMQGNVYVTGDSSESSGGVNYTTLKYSPTGTPLRTNYFNGSGNSEDYAIATIADGSGNICVTGYATGSGTGFDYATIKYSSAGVAIWTNLFSGPGNGEDRPNSLVVDSTGNVYVTGWSHNSTGGYDYVTIKYSGTAALPLLINTSDGSLGFTNGQFGFTLSGTAGQTVAIESSTNLQHWLRLQTNTLGSSQLYFSDPQSVDAATRFYRAVVLP